MGRLFTFLFVLIIFFYAACNTETGNGQHVKPETIYFDYQVWGEEDADLVTVMFQYRLGGRNGTTLLLEEPSKVEVDGQLLHADSSKMTGAFYELQRPMNGFAGKHTIVFTDVNSKKYSEEFIFQPFSFIAPLPDSIPRGDIVFELEGTGEKNYIRVVVTDTSRSHDGINRVDTVSNGRIVISKKDLQNISSGPVHLELIKEEDKSIKNGTPKGGRLSISYGLKKDFKLINTPIP